MSDENNAADEDNKANSDVSDDDTNDSDSEQQELEELLQKLKLVQDEWIPSFEFESSYIGNGFIDLTITDCNSAINLFELKYCFADEYDEAISAENYDFKTSQIRPKQLTKNTLLVRIPQHVYDYYFIFQFRAHGRVESTPITKWTEWSEIKSILIPFDAPPYQFKVGEIVLFQPDHTPFWSHGKITAIADGDNNEKIADILYPHRNKEDGTFKVNVNDLKFARRERNKLVDLTNWMDLAGNLFFHDHDKNVHQTFVAVHDALVSDIRQCIFTQNEEMDELQMSWIKLVYFGAIDQDIRCCARFIALNVAKFLEEPHHQQQKCIAYNVIDNGMSIGCGLCPIKSHYQTPTKLKSIWSAKMATYAAYGRQTGYKGGLNYDYVDMIQNGLGTMCDICLIEFHNMDYIYCCESSMENQHDICMPCMNRNVLEYKRLLNTLRELYYIHGLDEYSISQIVFCLVGLVR